MKVIFFMSTESITIEQCLECQKAGLDIFVDEGRIITVQDADRCPSLHTNKY